MIKYIHITLVLLFTSLIIKGQVTTQTLTNSANFTVPCAVTSITVQCWGGGGAGGGATGNPRSGGGGGAGGAYSYSVIGVTPGQTIAYVTGGGGNGDDGAGDNGDNTNFGAVIAVGGAGGARSNTGNVSVAGANGSSAGSVGSFIRAGGNGGGNILGGGNNAGGGGGGAGTTAVGGNGGTTTAGAGGNAGGGAGGAGGATGGNGGNGNNGTIPGGGGGGGRAGDNNDRDGGDGARGQIVISYSGLLTANAGANQTINSCVTTTAAISGNTVAGTTGVWTCIASCGGVTIVTPTSANTTVTGLVPGTSPDFRWTLTSTAGGCSVNDVVEIIIDDNPSFSANAGANQTIFSCLTTTANVSGNTVASTTGTWTCNSGCSGVTITSPNSANTNVTGLQPGVTTQLRWTLRSTTTGCLDGDNMNITIDDTPPFNANAGADQTLVSCSNTVASISGNTVASTTGTWSCIGNCAGVSITSPNSANTTVTNLTPNNVFTFRWTLSSSTNGCVSLDNVQIIVNCTATNDNPCSAIPITVNSAAICSVTTDGTVFGATTSTLNNTCGGNADDDVWFSFVANSTSQDISLLNVAGNSTDLTHAVYTAASCGAVANPPIRCSDPNNSTFTTTVGVTYYVRVFTNSNNTGRNTVFDICVKPTPPPPTNTSCAVQEPICSDTPISFQAQGGTGTADPGPNYGCLDTRPRPTWFYMEIATSGDVDIDITANSDVDFALWGPYPNLSAAQSNCTSYPTPIDCSYSNSNTEQANVSNALAGEVYVLLVTNYSGAVQTINLTNSGTSTGATNCGIVPNPLPIELVSFDATLTEDKQVLLNWITSTEKNNDFFEIQRSEDAYNWTKIGTQKGAGNSVILKNYQFTDKEPHSPISYYRLKQIDFDKTYAYSKIVSVDMASLPETISNLHPNPTKNIVNFNWKASKKGNVIIELIDYKGETIYSNTQFLEEGTTNLTVSVSEYKSGIYLLKVTNENTRKGSFYKILKL